MDPSTDTRSPAEVLAAAAAGDRTAWETLVDRYSGLVAGIARGYGLRDSDVADVYQTVWLRLLESLGALREPRALPGWLATTTRNECLRTLRLQRRTRPLEPDLAETWVSPPGDAAVDARLLAEERRDAVRAALASLPPHCRELLALLAADPPPSYDDVSRRLDMPRGSIGPTRGRCLGKLRQCPVLAKLLDDDASGAAGGRSGHAVAV